MRTVLHQVLRVHATLDLGDLPKTERISTELVEDSSRTESAGGGGVPLVARTQSLDGVYRDKNDAD